MFQQVKYLTGIVLLALFISCSNENIDQEKEKLATEENNIYYFDISVKFPS